MMPAPKRHFRVKSGGRLSGIEGDGGDAVRQLDGRQIAGYGEGGAAQGQ